MISDIPIIGSQVPAAASGRALTLDGPITLETSNDLFSCVSKVHSVTQGSIGYDALWPILAHNLNMCSRVRFCDVSKEPEDRLITAAEVMENRKVVDDFFCERSTLYASQRSKIEERIPKDDALAQMRCDWSQDLVRHAVTAITQRVGACGEAAALYAIRLFAEHGIHCSIYAAGREAQGSVTLFHAFNVIGGADKPFWTSLDKDFQGIVIDPLQNKMCVGMTEEMWQSMQQQNDRNPNSTKMWILPLVSNKALLAQIASTTITWVEAYHALQKDK